MRLLDFAAFGARFRFLVDPAHVSAKNGDQIITEADLVRLEDPVRTAIIFDEPRGGDIIIAISVRAFTAPAAFQIRSIRARASMTKPIWRSIRRRPWR